MVRLAFYSSAPLKVISSLLSRFEYTDFAISSRFLNRNFEFGTNPQKRQKKEKKIQIDDGASGHIRIFEKLVMDFFETLIGCHRIVPRWPVWSSSRSFKRALSAYLTF